MTDRLSIASEIAAGICAGIPFNTDEIIDDDDKKVIRSLARLSLCIADALIEENSGLQNGIQGN